jgi:hypothetical protein
MLPLSFNERQTPAGILIEGGPSRYGWSGIESFLRCERMYRLKTAATKAAMEANGGKRPVPTTGPLARGILGHIGLAHFYRRKMPGGEAYLEPEAAMRVFAMENKIELETWNAALIGYNHHMNNPVGGKIIEVETEHVGVLRKTEDEPTLGDPTPKLYHVSSALDLVFTDPLGGVWIEDHKFVSSASGIPDRYTLSGQFLIQELLGRAKWGSAFRGVIVGMNVCQAGGVGTKHLPLEVRPAALADFKAFYIETRERMAAREASGYYLPAFNEQICRGPYGKCEFFDRCQWGV